MLTKKKKKKRREEEKKRKRRRNAIKRERECERDNGRWRQSFEHVAQEQERTTRKRGFTGVSTAAAGFAIGPAPAFLRKSGFA